jgi:aryl-alcohol dehydrogenase-like predicted oxidoreductase
MHSPAGPAAHSTAAWKGFATLEGTRRYAARFAGRAAPGHFRELPAAPRDSSAPALVLSSIGIGTYLGEPDAATDQAYTDAVVAAVESGVNLIDTAINYRFQRSERSIGAALKKLAAAGFGRDEIVLCTKAGFLTPDGAMPVDANEYFYREYIKPGILRVDEIAARCHSMAPGYLENQLERSLRNLGVQCIDVFYLHNPETQLGEVSREDFRARLRAAFQFLESATGAGKIRAYGVATWNGFRQAQKAKDYLGLAEIVSLAREAGGETHHFRFVQLPFNLAMPEALVSANQHVDGRTVSMVQAGRPLGVALVTSSALLQGQLTHDLPPFVAEAMGLSSDLLRAIQFARSTPGITTALVGMSHAEHVRANLELARVEPAARDQFLKLFEQGGKPR